MYKIFTLFETILSKTQRNLPKGIDGSQFFWYHFREEIDDELEFIDPINSKEMCAPYGSVMFALTGKMSAQASLRCKTFGFVHYNSN